MTDLQGRVAVVTGSSRGIGAAIAEAMAAHGARVVVHGRDQAAISEVVRGIEGRGGEAMPEVADVTRVADLEALRARVLDVWGPIDILVANAGGSFTPPGPLEEITEEGWHASVQANLTATFLTIRTFLPDMKARRTGAILTVSSAAGRRPHPRSPIPYAAAKAGIQMMTQHLAAQVGPFGIRVNCIAPETILTDRNRERIPAAQQETLAQLHPIPRLGTPEDVASAALFLVGDESGWITGHIVDVSGGAVMV